MPVKKWLEKLISPKTRHRLHYLAALLRLKLKALSGKKIKVGFLVVYPTTFTAQPIFKKMASHKSFTPYILIAPDTLRGEDNMKRQIASAVKEFSGKFSNILPGYDLETGQFVDHAGNMDIIISMNPYDGLTHPYYRTPRLYALCKVLVYINYGYAVSNFFTRTVAPQEIFSLFWKVIIENDLYGEIFQKSKSYDFDNTYMLGSHPKMDDLALSRPLKQKKRPVVIIASHYSVGDDSPTNLNISCFFQYAEFFWRLPALYPQVDFVFRPHHLLSVALEQLWGKENTDKYFNSIKAYPNASLSTEPDYMALFAGSDAMIHDCASFLAEYFFVNKPVCYLVKPSTREQLSLLGRACLDHCYQAHEEAEITKFIENVVLAGRDDLAEERREFRSAQIKGAFPKASQTVVTLLEKTVNF